MNLQYRIERPEELLSPSLVVFRPIVERNLEAMLTLAGSPDRLRPHCKTHKMPAVVRMMLDRGISRHKAATIAEVEMLALCGVRDVVLAYHPVGPNIARTIEVRRRFPDVRFAVTTDDLRPAQELSLAATRAGTTVGVFLDLNPGRDRTGLIPGPRALELYQELSRLPGLAVRGFHVYDGHFHQRDFADRQAAVDEAFQPIIAIRRQLEEQSLSVSTVICGGTPTFPVYAARTEPWIELSPGTCTFHDANYGDGFPDLNVFQPAALLFTRVVSRPTPNRMTLDMGTKSVAADPPLGQRAIFPDLPDAVQVLHNEEHLVLETPQADRFQPGDWLLAVPRHVCPCSALHKEAYVVADGALVDRWEVVARDRRLSI